MSDATRTATLVANYVGGVWSAAAETFETRNPATGDVLARVPRSSAEETRAAIAAAAAAFPGWRETSPLTRARSLFRLRELLDAHREELARLVTADMGKTLPDALGEVGRGIESVEMACAAPTLLKGDNLEGIATAVDVELVRQPVGVVAAITPFNFPAMIPLWFLPFAVVCGNTFVLKPSELDPLTSNRIVELIHEHGVFPPGVVNVVHGGPEAVNALLDDPDVDAVSFVGSAATADHVYRRAAETGKRVQALGGAKNSIVMMPDADPEQATDGLAASAFGAAGQRCLAGSVAVLVGSAVEQDAARDRIAAAAAALTTGNGAEPDVDVGPLVTPAARERVENEVSRALDEGASLALDGRCDGGDAGAELGPTILDCPHDDIAALHDELFGPVLALKRVATLDEAIAWMNRSRYGNSAVIYTRSGAAARRFRYAIEAGMVGVNLGVAAPVAWFPFSGWKDSFNGDLHANGTDAIDFYTRKKVVTARWR